MAKFYKQKFLKNFRRNKEIERIDSFLFNRTSAAVIMWKEKRLIYFITSLLYLISSIEREMMLLNSERCLSLAQKLWKNTMLTEVCVWGGTDKNDQIIRHQKCCCYKWPRFLWANFSLEIIQCIYALGFSQTLLLLKEYE